MVAFSILTEESRSGWQLLRAGLSFSTLLCLLLVLSCLLFLTGLWSVKAPSRSGSTIQTASVVLALAFFFLVPVTALNVNISLSRKVALALSQNLPEPEMQHLFSRLDTFLYDGAAGENIQIMLGTFSYTLSPLYYLLLCPAFIFLISTLQLRCGRILQPLLRILLYTAVLLFSLFILSCSLLRSGATLKQQTCTFCIFCPPNGSGQTSRTP